MVFPSEKAYGKTILSRNTHLIRVQVHKIILAYIHTHARPQEQEKNKVANVLCSYRTIR